MELRMSFAAWIDFAKTVKVPDRVAYRSLEWDVIVKQFKTRRAMARAIRKQEHEGITRNKMWFPLIPLGDAEGY